MSYYETLNELYAKKIAGRSILLRESMPPVEAGDLAPDDATEQLKAHANTFTKTGELKRFYLYYIGSIKNISDDMSVTIAIDALNRVLQELKHHDDGIYPGPTKDFESEVVGPAVEEALAAGGVIPAKTYTGYISRALTDAAIKSGILKETGLTKRPSKNTSKKSSSASADEIAAMFGRKSTTPKPSSDEIGDIA